MYVQIVWEGNWISPNGHATVCRNMVRALARQGVDVRLVSTEAHEESAYAAFLDNDLARMANKAPAAADETIRIMHRVPTDFRRGNHRLTVGMTYTEATQMPRKWARAANTQVDALVLASAQSASAAKRAGVSRPIWVVPQGVDIQTFRPRQPGEPDAFDLPGFRFLSVFEWVMRKGYDKLLQAYWDEFTAADDVCLVIKTRYFGASSVQTQVNRQYERYLGRRRRKRRRGRNGKRLRSQMRGSRGWALGGTTRRQTPTRRHTPSQQRTLTHRRTNSHGTKVNAQRAGAKQARPRRFSAAWRTAWSETVLFEAPDRKLCLRFAPENKAPIYVYDGMLSDDELGTLYRHSSAFVLPTRGEGIGLPFLEAAATGLPLIVTDWGGQMEFLRRDDAYLVSYRLQAIPKGRQRSASLQGLWAEPRLMSLRRQMRLVYASRHEVSQRAVRQQQHVISNWNWDACASHLIAHLEGATGTRIAWR